MDPARRQAHQLLLGRQPTRLLTRSGGQHDEWAVTQRRQRLRLPECVGQGDDLVSHAPRGAYARGVSGRSQEGPEEAGPRERRGERKGGAVRMLVAYLLLPELPRLFEAVRSLDAVQPGWVFAAGLVAVRYARPTATTS